MITVTMNYYRVGYRLQERREIGFQSLMNEMEQQGI